MRRERRIAGLLAAVVLMSVACSGSAADERERASVPTAAEGADSTTTSSTTSTSTTSTSEPVEAQREFEPLYADPDLSTRDQVEAAYLYSWEVYLYAMESWDTSQLLVSYQPPSLDTITGEVERLRDGGERAAGHVEHNYTINRVEDDWYIVVDAYRNHLHRVDAETGEPVSEPTGDEVLYQFDLRRIDDRWLVTSVSRDG